MIDPNMNRWILASASKYFDDNKGNTFQYIMGDDVSPLANQTAWVEVRIHSLQFDEVSKDLFYYQFEVNIMCSVKDGTGYALESLVGKYQTVLCGEIPIFKYGTQSQDDQSFIGCFRLKFRTKVDTINWGPVQIDLNGPLRVMQTSLDATFEWRP